MISLLHFFFNFIAFLNCIIIYYLMRILTWFISFFINLYILLFFVLKHKRRNTINSETREQAIFQKVRFVFFRNIFSLSKC